MCFPSSFLSPSVSASFLELIIDYSLCFSNSLKKTYWHPCASLQDSCQGLGDLVSFIYIIDTLNCLGDQSCTKEKDDSWRECFHFLLLHLQTGMAAWKVWSRTCSQSSSLWFWASGLGKCVPLSASGIARMTGWVCFFQWELRVSLKSLLFCGASPHEWGEIILLYQAFTLTRFKRDSEVLLWWSTCRTEDCISFVFQTLLGNEGGRSQHKSEAIRSWCAG